MDTDKILYYTDGHLVTITGNGFKVKNTVYQLNAIKRHGLSIIQPARLPSTLLMILGIVVFISGSLNFLPAAWNKNVNIFGISLLANSVFMIAGVLVLAAGLLVMLSMKEKYAVKILTAEGEKNVVVSGSREYINKIVDALNRAFLDLTSKPDQPQKKQLNVLG
jgi:uncharacterized protein YjeT (DUF2065 family)